MSNDKFWSSVYSKADQETHAGRLSALRLVLLFGTVAVALALIIPPMVDVSADDWTLLGQQSGDRLHDHSDGVVQPQLHDSAQRSAAVRRFRLHHRFARPQVRRLLNGSFTIKLLNTHV